MLTTLKGGIGVLCERAAAQLKGVIRYNHPVTHLAKNLDGGYSLTANNEAFCVDAVVMAAPAQSAVHLMQNVGPAAAAALQGLEYAPMTVVCSAYPRGAVGHDMNGFGFLAPRNQGKRVLGCIWTSSVFPDSAPAGMVFLRSMFGGSTDPEAMELKDGELLACLEREVHPLLKIAQKPSFVKIYRHASGIPQYGLEHGAFLTAVELAENVHPGLVFAGNAYRGVSLNDCVVSGKRAADRVTAHFDG